MAKNSNTAVLIYVVVSIVVIGVILYLLIKCKNKDKFCTCQGMNSKRCPNPQNLQALYNSGKLTEFTNLAAAQDGKWRETMAQQFQPYKNTGPSCSS